MVLLDKTPIALFAYNRPKHLQAALQALADCQRLDECHLVIFCDGAKTPQDIAKIEAARRVAEEWAARLGGEVITRNENLGLARSIVTGVTSLCEQFGRVIVLEDDLVVAPGFLCFMLEALDRYRDNSRVYQISGYIFPIPDAPEADAVFLPLTTTWGWATWERAWRVFDWNATGALEQLSDSRLRSRFDLEGAYPFSAMLEQRLGRQLDSWGILWWWAVFKWGGVVLYPPHSLVRNIGFDGSGIHHRNAPNSPFARKISPIPYRMSFNWPERVETDSNVFDQVVRFLRAQGQSRKSRFLSRFKRAMI
jgi:hypothetical protein